MKKMNKKESTLNYRKPLLFMLILNLMTISIYAFIRLHPSFAEFYTINIYPILVATIGRITSIFPFSLIEFLLFLLCLYIVRKFILYLYRRFKKHDKNRNVQKANPIHSILRIGVGLSFLLFLYTLTCGINYHRNTFFSYTNLTVTTYTTEDLAQLSKKLVEETNRLASDISVDKDGDLILPDNVKNEAIKSMKKLKETYPVLSGYYPKPKPVLTSIGLSYQQIMGIYSPFTIEANFNNDMPTYNMPWTMCHELSHVKGFMRENEAEFIAYLACINSDNKIFNYSGNLMALTYSLNALSNSGEAKLSQTLYQQLSEKTKKILVIDDAYWDNYRGTVSEIAAHTNDVYLKANSQTDGQKSYGKMVDLLLAYYKQNQ